MTFTGKTALNFFIQKILDQANKENISFSKAQEYVLSLNGIEPDSYSNQELIKSFEQESSVRNFENKIIKLISKAYRADMSTNSTLLANYKEAYKTLKSGNYYVYYLTDRSIGSKINKIGRFFDTYASDDEYVLGALFTGLLASLQILYLVLTLLSGENISDIVFNGYFLLALISNIGVAVYLVRKYLQLTRKGLYDVYFKQTANIANRISLKRAVLNTTGFLAIAIFLLAREVNRFINYSQRNDYAGMIFGSIGIILYGLIVSAILGLFYIAFKMYSASQKRNV